MNVVASGTTTQTQPQRPGRPKPALLTKCRRTQNRTHMVNLEVYGLLVFWAEHLGDGDILALREGGRGTRVRVYLLSIWLEVGGVVLNAL